MSAHALLGLLGLDLLLVVVGDCLLFALGALESRRLWWLTGFAWLLAAATLGIVLSIELVLGLSFGLTTLAIDLAALAGAGLAVGIRRYGVSRRIPRPARGSVVISAAGAGTVALLLEAQFRAGRL